MDRDAAYTSSTAGQTTPQMPTQISSTSELQLREAPTNAEHFLHISVLEL